MADPALQKAAQALSQLKRLFEEAEKMVDGLEANASSSWNEGLANEASSKVAFVDERVNKLRSSPVVVGSAQLKPHVDFLVARVGQCKSKLDALKSAGSRASSRPAAAPLAPPPVLQSEEEVVVDMLSPLGPRASQVAAAAAAAEIAGPPKLPQKPENKSKSHIIDRPKEDDDARKKVSGSQISHMPTVRTQEVARKEVSAMDILGSSGGGGGVSSNTGMMASPRGARSPRDLRGAEQMSSTPLLKISSSTPSRSQAAAASVPISADPSTPLRRPSRPEIDPGLGSPSPAVNVSTPVQIPPPVPDRKSAVLDFDKLVGRVRGDSLVSDETPVDSGGETNWKAEYEKMAQKFESAKGLIVKMQEKTRRMELQAAQVPALLKKTSQLEGKVASLEMIKTHYEEKVPQLNTRIVELENELLVMKNMVGNSALDQMVVTGERVWVSYNHLWHEGEVIEKNPEGSFLIKLDAVLDPKVFGPERVRKITVEGLESTPVVSGISGISELEDSGSSLSVEPGELVSSGFVQPAAIEPRPVEQPAPASTGTPSNRPAMSTTMDSLLASTKQNVKNLFAGGGGRRKATDGPSSQPSSGASTSTSSTATPSKAQDKLRSLFGGKERSSVMIGKNEDGSSGVVLTEEIPADAVALGDLQRIYVSDLWTALMDPGSSEALIEVFFTTFEYHCSWEQVLGTLSTVYNESLGTEPEALERRVQVLKLVQKMVSYNPELLKQKATPSNFLKSISFADPNSLSNTGEDDPESLQARGKVIVGDYGTVTNAASAVSTGTGPGPSATVSGSLPVPKSVRDNARSPANPSRGSVNISASRKPTLSGTPPSIGSSASGIPQLGGGGRGTLKPVSPRMRTKTDASPRMLEPGGSGIGEDQSFREEDLSDEVTSDEMDGMSFEETEDNDLRTRKKGQALFKSIGAVYKSLNMDSQSLQNVFVTNMLNSSAASTTEGGDATEVDDSVSVSGESSTQPVRQLTFLEALSSWLEASNVANDKANPEVEKLMNAMTLWRRGPSRRKSRSVVAKKLVHQKKGMLSNVRDFASVQITSFSPLQVAKQLFLEEWELFAAIKPSEFRKKRFMDAKSGHSFQYMVHRFNTWCSWIATEVLNRNTSLERANIIEFFIDVATECNKFHNFNSCYAVIGALNQPSVARLKFSWDRVSKKSMRAYNRILAFWSTSHNMGNYRAELKKIKPPAVPYLGLIGKDLFQTEEGTPTVLSLPSDEEWILNFYKLRSLAQQFKFISRLQQVSDAPEWEVNMDLATCISAVTPYSDEEGYERSLKLEPRNITQAELYTMEHGPSVIQPPNASSQQVQQQAEDTSDSSSSGVTHPSGAGSSAGTGGATAQVAAAPIVVRNSLASYRGSPELDKFAKGLFELRSPASMELLATVAVFANKVPEFLSGKKSSFTVAQIVTWLVKELGLLEGQNKYDVEAAEAAKGTAVKIVEGMRALGFVVPAKKWAAKLQGTLRTGGFNGFALKAEDQSVWSVDTELLEKSIQDGK